jgi:hypothetical protein
MLCEVEVFRDFPDKVDVQSLAHNHHSSHNNNNNNNNNNNKNSMNGVGDKNSSQCKGSNELQQYIGMNKHLIDETIELKVRIKQIIFFTLRTFF